MLSLIHISVKNIYFWLRGILWYNRHFCTDHCRLGCTDRKEQMCIRDSSTFPFYTLEGWEMSPPAKTDLPLKGDTVIENDGLHRSSQTQLRRRFDRTSRWWVYRHSTRTNVEHDFQNPNRQYIPSLTGKHYSYTTPCQRSLSVRLHTSSERLYVWKASSP